MPNTDASPRGSPVSKPEHRSGFDGVLQGLSNPLTPIFLVVFIDLVGVGIALPILAPLFLDPVHGLLTGSESLELRTLLMGVLIASYSFAQFLGAPILGGLSDRFGRKKMLLLSLAGTLAGYVIFGLGILAHNLALLFAGRLIDGITGGNISIALSAIADVSEPRAKARNFGLIGMAFGLGFIIGPYIGGLLSNPAVLPWFDYATPFWFAAGLVALNMAMMQVQFRETLRTRTRVKIDPWMGFRNVRKALSLPALRAIFITSFLFVFGFSLYNQFLQVFLFEKFRFGAADIGNFFAYIGVCVALVQGLLTGPVSALSPSARTLRWTLAGAAVALGLLILPPSSWMLYLLIPPLSVFVGLTFPNLNSVISGLGGGESQGELLGLNQSVQALAMAIPPLLAGFAVAWGVDVPILLAGLFTGLGWGVFVLFFKERAAPKFHEV
ncbi:MAG: MFS transporter [Candidatus Micrarchaeota archaeon]|nr:MFS transporter [Candidatus Micrarchaeota archaeon]